MEKKHEVAKVLQQLQSHVVVVVERYHLKELVGFNYTKSDLHFITDLILKTYRRGN
jgi:hypothetical protein